VIQRQRAVTTVAVGFLTLDAVLLFSAGALTRRPGFFVAGGVCALAAVFVVLLWRRYRRTLAELARARREMRAEIESIRELLQRTNAK
jgi:HAMP domain-containing protein